MEYLSKIIGNICIFTRNLTHRICPSKDISFHPTELQHETSATSLVAAAYHKHPQSYPHSQPFVELQHHPGCVECWTQKRPLQPEGLHFSIFSVYLVLNRLACSVDSFCFWVMGEPIRAYWRKVGLCMMRNMEI